MTTNIQSALDKIKKELKEFKGGQMEAVMKDRCAEVLCDFCKQDEEFAQAVVQSSKTFSDCLKSITDKYGKNAKQQGISDLDAFKQMVQFYFAGAVIHLSMQIDLIGNASAPAIEIPKPSLSLSLDSLLDF